MANVKFLRGLQTNLPADGSAVDGVFYLTTDTNRLYVGQGTNKKLLNQTVQIVSSVQDLTDLTTAWGASANQHINDFYYVSGKNILAVYTGTGADQGWVQINPDTNTTVTGTSLTPALSSTDDVTVTLDITDSNNTQNLDSNVHFIGDNGVHVSVDNGKVKIAGEEYSLSEPSAVVGNATTITLTNDTDNSKNSSFSIEGAGGVTVSKTGSKITLTSANTTLNSGSTTIAVDDGEISIDVSDSDNNTASGSIQRVGVALNNGTYAPIDQMAAGTQTGAIYSKTEIDNMIGGLNGMTYKGSIASTGGSVSQLPSSGVKNGDVYVVAENGFDLTTGNANFSAADLLLMGANGARVRVGDMVITKGTETYTTVSSTTDYFITSNLEWTYIPSGNESLDIVTYEADHDNVSHTFSLKNGLNETIATHTLIAGTDIALSSAVSGTGDTTIATTINHGTITTSAPTAAATLSSGTASFTAIKGLTISNGHVTAIETDTFTPVTYTLTGATSAQGSNVFDGTYNTGVNDVNVTMTLENSNNDSNLESSAVFKLSSSSIKLNPANNGTITMDLEWGTF